MMNWTADFPILAADENGNRLVYLDSAATTQHPMQVLNAVVDYYTKENANPHRGVYELAMRATDAHEGARHTVAQFFNAEDDEIVFTQNTTESLNLVAYSYGMNFLHEGDEIVISVAEHHSNMVPWQRVAKATGAKLVYMYPGENGRLTTEELDKKITPKTKVVAVAMVSNVLGLRAPVEEIVKRATPWALSSCWTAPRARPILPWTSRSWTWILRPALPTSCTPPWASVRCTHAPDCWKRCPRS